MIVSLCDIIFMYDHRYYSAQRTLNFVKISNYLKGSRCLKVTHAYQGFLEHNSKALSYRSVEQLEMSCLKRGEGFSHVDCSISYFGRIKLSWNSRQDSISNGNNVGGVATTAKKYSVIPDVFRGGWVGGLNRGLNRKHHFDVLRDKLGMDVALYIITYYFFS